jgi:uncharacterized membrane-anchored protein
MIVMKEKEKYELEEMFEAYSRNAERINQRLGKGEPPAIDFDKLNAFYRDWRRRTSMRVSSVAAVIAVILFVVTPAADGYAMTTVVDRMDQIGYIDYYLLGHEVEG